ncbi:MAG: DNA cytosine methyltransferase [Candidatus Promineifilaceae bacterium]
MKFIDLFAGLGGFHIALKELGHECVFASEINNELCELYKRNFGFEPKGDVRRIDEKDIPEHDILCAGFPCQPFSKAGYQLGFDCPTRGTLFYDIIRILEYHQPRYVILENVANLRNHDKGNTWKVIERELKRVGYSVADKILSPHDYGVPQVRDRLFIVGSRTGLEHFHWPAKQPNKAFPVDEILEKNPPDAILLPERIKIYLTIWQEFLDNLGSSDLPLPIWSMEFGANYPYETTTPYAIGLKDLRSYKGVFGTPLQNLTDEQIATALPSYSFTHPKARVTQFPKWKINYIRKNRTFYELHKSWLDKWMLKVQTFGPSFQKFEWNCKGEKRDISQLVVQLRASGIRVKRRNTISSLVGITTQVPIITWENRYMTPRERARLQSMDNLTYLPDISPSKTTEALGNAVNVNLVKMIAESLISKSQ